MFPPLACKVSIKKKIFSDSFQNPLLTSDPGRCFWVSMFYSYFICFRFFRINLEIFYIVCFSLYLNQYSCLSLLGLFQLFICNTNIHWHCIDWESTHLVDLGQSFVNAWNNIFGEKNKQKLPFRWVGPSISWIDVLVDGFVSTRKTFDFAEHRMMFTKKTNKSEFRSMLLLIAIRPWLRACILQEIDCIHRFPLLGQTISHFRRSLVSINTCSLMIEG